MNKNRVVTIWACPAGKGGSGYLLQVLARIRRHIFIQRSCSLWAFRSYPSRGHTTIKKEVTILWQPLFYTYNERLLSNN